jgi:5-methylcytosine-specific restriction endonuclease McrA
MPEPKKQDVMNQISDCLGIPRHATSKQGSTEPRPFLDDVAIAIGVLPSDYRNKQVLAEGLARFLGEEWDASCDCRERPHAGGGTVTLEGLQRILRGLQRLLGNRHASFALEVQSALQRLPQMTEAPAGNPTPSRDINDPTGFRRSAEVAAWTLYHASGKCALCANPAPFITRHGDPYLEVHHVRPLAEGGPDTVDNVAALCPNCHRRAHFSKEINAIRDKLLDILRRSPTHRR